MATASIPTRPVLSLAGDDRLVAQIRRGNEAAFEVVFERHAPAILAFCRHMLGSREEAEDAVQHTFAAAYRNLRRSGDREIALKPWLFTIARNRCLSILRARRDTPTDELDLTTPDLAEEVERRAELRLMLADLRELPDDQRAALLLAEVSDLSHAEVGGVLGCEARKVKGLVYQARSRLIARRAAREASCDEIREQLANLRGGALRRNELRLHLAECAGCRSYREEVRRQRELLAAALPVAPTLGLKANALAAAGIGGATAAAGGGAIAGGGGALVAKVAMVGVLAGAGIAGGQAVVSSHHAPTRPPAQGVGHFMGRDEPIKRPTPRRQAPAAAVKPKAEAPGREQRARRPATPRAQGRALGHRAHVPKEGTSRAGPKPRKNTRTPRATGPHGAAPGAKGPKAKAPKAKGPKANAPSAAAPKHVAPKHVGPKHVAPKHRAPKHVAPKAPADHGVTPNSGRAQKLGLAPR